MKEEASPDASGQCPGDSAAPGFCEGGTSPGENGYVQAIQ